MCSSRQETAALLTDAATETRVSCSGLKPRVQTEKQAGYEGDASLKLSAASTALAGFMERTWEVLC